MHYTGIELLAFWLQAKQLLRGFYIKAPTHFNAARRYCIDRAETTAAAAKSASLPYEIGPRRCRKSVWSLCVVVPIL